MHARVPPWSRARCQRVMNRHCYSSGRHFEPRLRGVSFHLLLLLHSGRLASCTSMHFGHVAGSKNFPAGLTNCTSISRWSNISNGDSNLKVNNGWAEMWCTLKMEESDICPGPPHCSYHHPTLHLWADFNLSSADQVIIPLPSGV